MTSPRDILIVGATPQGLQGALTLAHLNFKVTLIDRESDLQKPPRRWSESGKRWFLYLLKQISYHPLIEVETQTKVAEMREGMDGVEVECIQKPQWVLPSSCVDCRKCIQACPVDLPDGGKPISETAAPTSVVIDKRERAPCGQACPLGMNVQGYVALLTQGKIEEAYEIILETNPLPGVCGRVCHHPCESACRRHEIDEPIAICHLKRFAADEARKTPGGRGTVGVAPLEGPRVAIIGSGPAGLTAAYDLVRAGFRPTLMEAEGEPGGLLRHGIAPYRLPRRILDEEIGQILAMGVDLRLNTPLSTWEDLERLWTEGFHAILLATGASKDLLMGIRGENLQGVSGCVDFLRGLWKGRMPESLGRVAVIGGGNAAIEAARACVRSGARSVALLYRRTRKEMPADPHEIAQALEEGVKLRCLTLPVEFQGRGNRLERIRCMQMQLEGLDDSGRPKPVPVAGSDFLIRADTAIVSIGQAAGSSYAMDGALEVTRWGAIVTSRDGETNVPKIYASGDVVSGPSTVVEAMASGRKAAQRIIRSLGGTEVHPALHLEPDRGEYGPIPKGIPREGRRPIPHRAAPERSRDYGEVIGPFAPHEAMKEASRCLQCGVCSECLLCEASCGLGAIAHDRISAQRSLRVDRIIVADPTQSASEIAPPRVVRLAHAKTGSWAKAMAQGRAGALDAVAHMPIQRRPPIVKRPLGHGDLKAGVFLCSCNGALNEDGRLEEILVSLEGVPGVEHREVLLSACHPDKGLRIEEAIHQRGLNGALIAACACCHLDFVCESCTDQRIRLKQRLFGQAGYEPEDIALVNIKETCLLSFQDDRERGIDLALRVIGSGLLQLKQGKERSKKRIQPTPQAVVLGATDAGILAARGLKGRIPSVVVVDDREIERDIQEELRACGIDVLCPVRPVRLDGQWGEFTLILEEAGTSISPHPRLRSLPAGVVILGREACTRTPYKRDAFTRTLQIGKRGVFGTLETNVPGVYMASWSQVRQVDRAILGKAAACQALEEFLPGADPSGAFVARVDPELCHGCGRCADICPQGAARLDEITRGVACARIEPTLCVGCGNCIAECPTGAIQMPESDQGYFQKVMDVLLG